MALSKDNIFELLVKRLDGIITPEEEAMLAEELENNEEARLAWFNLHKKWDDVAVKAYLANIDLDERRQKFLAGLRKEKRIATTKTVSWIAAASVLVIAAVAGAYILLTPTKPITGVSLQLADGKIIELPLADSSQIKAGDITLNIFGHSLVGLKGATDTTLNTLKVPNGTQYTITLPDNSVVRLNAGTTLRFPFTFPKGKREIYLEHGEGYFSITPDPNKHFIVHTDKADITVLGTSFNVNIYDNTFTTSLVSGSLLISTQENKRKIIIKPGYQAKLDLNSGEFLIEQTDSTEALDWLQGEYHFNDESLIDILKTAERLYNVKINLTDPNLGKLRFKGVIIVDRPISRLFSDLNLAYPAPVFTYSIDTDQINIYPVKK